METLYDVQKLLKKFGIYVYIGRRIWDIEVMALELDYLREAQLVADKEFLAAKMVLTREHRIEENKLKENNETGGL